MVIYKYFEFEMKIYNVSYVVWLLEAIFTVHEITQN